MEHVVEADWFEERARFTNLLQWLCLHGFEKTFGAVLPPIEEDTVAEKPKSAAFQLLNTTNEIGETPLMLAAETGYAHIVSQLLAYGARVECISEERSTALVKAAWKGHTDVVELLLKDPEAQVSGGYERDGSPLFNASQYGHAKATQLLIDKRETSSYSRASITSALFLSPNFTTPLIAACFFSSAEMVDLLLSCPTIDADLRDEHGNTILHGYSFSQPRLLIDSGKFALGARITLDRLLWRSLLAKAISIF
jgi:ankyrin repeat protein